MTIAALTEPVGPPALDDAERVTRRLRVLIADGDAFARRMMRDALQAAAEIVVIADVPHPRDALELSRYFEPEVLLIDMDLPGSGGLELARAARSLPETRVAMLCSRYDEEAALPALRAGVVGYLSKEIEPYELRGAVRRIAAGEAVIPPTLARRVIELLGEAPDSGWRPVRSCLTTREWEIVELIAAGDSTGCIADRLVLSRSTVYSHVKSVLRKLGVHSREEAVRVAVELRREEVVRAG